DGLGRALAHPRQRVFSVDGLAHLEAAVREELRRPRPLGAVVVDDQHTARACTHPGPPQMQSKLRKACRPPPWRTAMYADGAPALTRENRRHETGLGPCATAGAGEKTRASTARRIRVRHRNGCAVRPCRCTLHV